MPIDWPINPTPGQIYNYDDKSWTWNGFAWDSGFLIGMTGGINIYTSNGTISENRVVSISGDKTLSFNPEGSPSSTLKILPQLGFVGIGTSSPSAPLHVNVEAVPSTNETITRFTVSDAPGAYLDLRNGSTANGSFRAQVVGRQVSGNSDSALSIDAYIDVTRDIVATQPVMLFRTAKVSGTTLSALSARTLYDFRNWTDSVMVIDSLGFVGIGTSSPTNNLHVSSASDPVKFSGLQSSSTNTRILSTDTSGVIKYRDLSELTTTFPVSFKLGFNGIPNYEVFAGTGIQNFGLLDRGMFVAFDLDTALSLPHTETPTDYVFSFRVTTHEQFGGVANNVGVRTIVASISGQSVFNTIFPSTYLSQTSTNYALQFVDLNVTIPKNYLSNPVYYVKFEIIMERLVSGSTSVIGSNLRFKTN